MIGMNGIWNIDSSALALNQFPSVEDRVALSTNQWADDLRGIYNNARDRFSDVAWETDTGERIFAHKGACSPTNGCDRVRVQTTIRVRARTSESGESHSPRRPCMPNAGMNAVGCGLCAQSSLPWPER